ncbi:MAG: ROK family protein [Bacteroidales bacterium]|nr:ROK family protein [Bacteroidales bacterium]
MNYSQDNRIVMTLDAGGTNFVFSAIQGNEEIVDPIRMPSDADNLEKCLNNIVNGFAEVKNVLKNKPVAISFAFPGPADYANGIIGDLGNLPSFRGGVALGPMLEEKFNIPVFINNDGDLFAYGEAIAGFLPEINYRLLQAGSEKQYRNLLGITLGTGFGAGIVSNNELFLGDNGAAAEIWLMRNKLYPQCFAEEGASIRAVRRVYMQHSTHNHTEVLTPKDIYDIATGAKMGDRAAAIRAFSEMAEVVGDALANAITLIDGLIVIGGGLAGAASLFLPTLVDELNKTIFSLEGHPVPRLEVKSFNLENDEEFQIFARGEVKQIKVPGTNRSITYDPMKRIGVGLSRLGTSKAIALGAYAFALRKLDSY